jgi:hypothetical protein
MLLTITFDFDFSLDANGFFNDMESRDALVAAGEIVLANLDDTLTAIVPGSISPGDTWTANYPNPSNGDLVETDNLTIDENVIRVFAGGRELGATLGIGGPGGFGARGTRAWLDIVAGRGQAGALLPDAQETDFGPWGGTVTFNTTTNWHFGIDTSGLDNGESDFLSVAIHELYHLIGFGTADSWDNLVDGTSFTGPAAIAEFDLAGNPPVQFIEGGIGGHWEDGTTDNGAETAMDPVILVGTRKLPTPLDVAGLDDIGWEIAQATAPSVQVDLRIRRTSTTTDPNGETTTIPDNVDFLDEWDEFVVEVWASTPADDTSAVASFTVDIAFDELLFEATTERLFEATTIDHGAAFTDTRQGMIDNSSGLIQGVSASTPQTSIALTDFALLARVFFQVRAEADLPNNLSGEYILPTIDDEFLVQSVAISMSGGVAADVNAQTATSIEVWPVMFDLDDDGSIGFSDVAELAVVFGTSLGTNDGAYRADFDHDGIVGFADISLFAGNFGSARNSLVPQTYDGGFPSEWRPPAALSAPQGGESNQAAVAITSGRSSSASNRISEHSPSAVESQLKRQDPNGDGVEPVDPLLASIAVSALDDSLVNLADLDDDSGQQTSDASFFPGESDWLWTDAAFGLFAPLEIALRA